MLDRQRTRREAPNAVRVEDVIPAEILDGVGDADRDYLEQVFRDPQKFLPPRPEPVRDAEQAVDQGEPESRFARRAKLAGLLAAGALVAGAVIAAPMLTSAHRAVSAGDAATPADFTGAAELGGLAVPQRQAGGGAPEQSGPTTPQGTHSGGAPSAQESTSGGSPQPQAAPKSDTTVPDAAADPRSATRKIQAVKNFYAAIAKNSDGALALLSPTLADGAAGELVRTWSAMDAIDVQEADTQIKPDGSIVAVATLHRPDGALVRVTQLFRVADTGGLITEAELVSAQYM
ncbi:MULTISPECIES: hypothetical protein [unclassified Amycolatopsis]|uniref:hypothetical protein n=1 Tax=unclassified Amycolatopsis TaxID=2618356 RepID=UPI002E125261|nr:MULTISPECIES: hypothetical protein [unclassified Amycolatopsis]WSJ76053.1 hypothetical protein OG439_42735 [Amycolatopsis sp. NBC_01307]WSK80342.1 hypothetical protein OG570_07155 [Amycolatopsis sp. NBC_01286]